MKTLKTLLISFFCLWLSNINAQSIDTVRLYSTSMQKDINNLVILPESYADKTSSISYPVVYLLHGHGGNYTTWTHQIKPDLDRLASSLNIIIVCPDGANSWYWDSPENPSSRYETYVTQELREYVDKHYHTLPNRNGRAITGFSMGGHGGLWLGFRHPDLYGSCGSMSGGVDIRPFQNNWDMKKQLGNYNKYPQRWKEHTVIELLPYNLQYGPLAIIIDCGTEDFFYQVNQKLHEKLLYYNIPHEYITRPGYHNFEYWRNAIDYQLLFFRKFFDKAVK